jgi:pSer/pThr/pTyr-binding forkhead associated (FHA) protein
MHDSTKPENGSSANTEHMTVQVKRASESGQPPAEQLLVIGVEVVGGPMDGQNISVEGSVVTIGRTRDNDLSLGLDSAVSTRHARIVREHQHFWLEDLGSTNGTFVGDLRIRERTLIGPGTLFGVGKTRLEFQPR